MSNVLQALPSHKQVKAKEVRDNGRRGGQNPIAAPSRRVFVLGAGALLLSGCGVPRGAPSKREVLAGATRTEDGKEPGFALEIVTRDRLGLYPQWGSSYGTTSMDWPAGNAMPVDQRLAPGDRLQVRIWDAEESSLITSPGAQFSEIQNVQVSASGFVNLPYIDQVEVGGLSHDAARARLQERLTAITPSAQVQLSVEQGRLNSVDMLGGVAQPGSYPLAERNLPLSSLISASGGVLAGLENPQVQITRGGRVFRRPLKDVMANPVNDPALQGGDRVLIEADPRTFTGLGAAGREEVIRFNTQTVSALRAVSMMGGLADTRADPKGILVLRRYGPAAAGKVNGPPHMRVVFSFDLTGADGLFAADEFALENGDIVLATQSPGTTTQRVLGLFGSILGFGRAASEL
jgi:polysaccharide biosynthesis/export protein